MHSRFSICLLIIVSVTGCFQNDAPAADDGAEMVSPPMLPPAAVTFAEPVVVDSQVPRYGIADEPTVSSAPDGTIYVSAKFALLHDYFTGNPGNARVWRSDDGVTFEMLNDATGRLTDGKQGNQDTDLYVDRQGVVHLADLSVPAVGSTSVPYLRSSDRGESWEEVMDFRIEGKSQDRQWIAGDGDQVVVIWRALPGAVGVAFSNDRGDTWNVSSVDVDHRKLGNVAVANGTVVFALLRGDADLVLMRSNDSAATWQEEHVDGTPPGSEGILFPTVALSASGTTHAAIALGVRDTNGQWTGASVFVTQTTENGTWAPLAERSVAAYALMPSMLPLPDGRVAMSYLATEDGGDLESGPHAWHVFVDVGTPTGDVLVWTTTQVSQEPSHDEGMCLRGGGCAAFGRATDDRRMGEIFEIAATPDGDVLVVWPDTSHGTEGLAAILFARGGLNET